MSKNDFDLLTIARGTITAPAGCGKTYLIADALTRHVGPKPVLVLTHTNAGVAALRTRLGKAGVPPKAYRLATIDGWAMRLISTFPVRSGHDPNILQLGNPKVHYPAIKLAAAHLLKAGHLGDVLAASYDRLVVDEYQDCSLVQHAIIYYAAATLPTCVLGDPMQAIFGFQGNELADWERHVCVHFPVVGELNTPWRWNNAKEEEFGIWLLDVRRKLLAGEAIDLVSAPRNVSSIRLNGVDDHKLRLQAALAKAPTADGCVLIIADATNPDGQRQFASQIPGAVTAENVDLKDFVSFAQKLDLMAPNALQNVVYFAASVMTNVGAPDLIERIATLRAGRERREASNVERAALAFAATPTFDGVANLLVEISKEGGVQKTPTCNSERMLQGSENV